MKVRKKRISLAVLLIVMGIFLSCGIVSHSKNKNKGLAAEERSVVEEKLLTEQGDKKGDKEATNKGALNEEALSEETINEGVLNKKILEEKRKKDGEKLLKKQEIEDRIKNYLGKGVENVGFVYYDLTSGEKISINENKVCVAASTYKVGMNIVAYDLARKGKLNLDQGLKYSRGMYEGGTGILQGQINTTLKNKISVQKLLDLSIKYSDNIATNMISRRLGGVQVVRKAVCDITGINVDTKSNKITPEMEFRLLKELYENRSDEYNAHLLDVMKDTVFHDGIDKYIPGNIVAHKTGNYGSYTNDVGIVFANKPYVFVMYVDGLSNAYEKIATVSKIIYDSQMEMKYEPWGI